MTQDDPTPESLYADWRWAHSDAGDGDFDLFCKGHPDLEDRLRWLHARLKDIDGLLGPNEGEEGLLTVPIDGSLGTFDGPFDGPFDVLVEKLKSRRSPRTRYEQRREIGKGGMGCVYELFDTDLRRPVAKKVMLGEHDVPGSGASGTTRLGRFCEEAQITAQLTHPGVLSVHELGIDESDQVFFTMDLVQGKTLQEVFNLARAQKEGWNVTRAVGVLERVCETLAYAHSRGVIHRDLKPDNVMVGSFGEVYTLDWGLAKLMGEGDEGQPKGPVAEGDVAVSTDRRDASDSDLFAGVRTIPGVMAGTPGFMSPEQARGDLDSLDERTDVYSMGAMLYVLLTGQVAFTDQECAEDILDWLNAMRHGQPTPVEHLAPQASPELASIARRAMSAKAEDRYPDAHAMGTDLRAWLEGRVVAAYEQGAWAQLRKWVGRNRGLAASILLAILAVTGGSIGMAIFERNGRLGVERQRLIAQLNAAPTQLAGLFAEVESLWPAIPANGPAMERWLEERAALASQEPLILEAVNALTGKESFFTKEELDPRGLADLQRIAIRREELDGKTEQMTRRLQLARLVEEWQTKGEDRWEQAANSIASSAQYGGLQLTPQLGLLPLREDPQSGLWEFWHLLSGAQPVLDPATDSWRIDPAMGIVLVLIPGGEQELGIWDEARGHELYDNAFDAGRPVSDPLHYSVTLDPFFLSKYEMTQAQWTRVQGARSRNHPSQSGTFPVNFVSWDSGMAALGRLDLTLPTEAQWEFAGRGGAATRFYTGQDPASLVGHAVLFPNMAGWGDPDLDENGEIANVFGLPYRAHPEAVGSLAANPFGLHDVHGNVWEWCLDPYAFEVDPAEGDGLQQNVSDVQLRVMRGGGYSGTWTNTRLGFRFEWRQENGEPDTGLRPARAVR